MASFPVIGAYIVFNDKISKINCLRTFKRANRLCANKPPVTKIDNKMMKIKGKVDEPSNIKWEYLDAT